MSAATMDLIRVLEGRLGVCKDRVIAAEKNKHESSRFNADYHKGEVAALNFALARVRETLAAHVGEPVRTSTQGDPVTSS